jgi:hypothetical protein
VSSRARDRHVRAVAALAIFSAACNSLLGIEPFAIEDAGSDATTHADAGSGSGADADAALASDVAHVDVGPDGPPADPDAADAPIDVPVVPADGTAVLGESCNASWPCAAGLECFSGVCHEPCTTVDAACASPGFTCVQTYGNPNHLPLAKYCYQTGCDLLDAASCGPSDANMPVGCYFSHADLARDCIQMGTSTHTCPNGVYDCKPGYACDNSFDAQGTCDPWCATDHPCLSGACDTLGGVFVIDGGVWGICR